MRTSKKISRMTKNDEDVDAEEELFDEEDFEEEDFEDEDEE